MSTCQHCGMIHQTTCPRIRAIDYYPDGSVKKIEFHAPVPIVAANHPTFNIRLPDAPSNTTGRL